jgi:hypothetical protein
MKTLYIRLLPYVVLFLTGSFFLEIEPETFFVSLVLLVALFHCVYWIEEKIDSISRVKK